MVRFTIQMRIFAIERVLKEKVPKDLALLILSFLKHEVVPWDSFDLWIPEYDRDGNYAYLPMCQVDLPMW